MLYVVVQHYKLQRSHEVGVFGIRSAAEEYIDNLLSVEGLFDYKVSFTIEELDDEKSNN